MYLFFDTETTGLPRNYKAPITDLNNWPRMVQLAWLEYDFEGGLIQQRDYIIKPEGFTIPLDAARVHGIHTERALAEGQALADVLAEFAQAIGRANCLVAHNISFDEKIIGAEFLRSKMDNYLQGKSKKCTMEIGTFVCKIPSPYGGYKWPRLSELHRKLFKTDFTEMHNAVADIGATAKCFWEMRRIGIIQ